MKGAKPCPFCGGDATVEYFEPWGKWVVFCDNPKCKIKPSTDAHVTKGVVVREWNRRANND